MIMNYYNADTLEKAFDFAFKIDMTLKGLLLIEAWEQCSKCKGYRHYDYQCPSESRHVRIAPSDNVDDLKVV